MITLNSRLISLALIDRLAPLAQASAHPSTKKPTATQPPVLKVKKSNRLTN